MADRSVIRVAIAAESPMVEAGLRVLLQQEADIAVSGLLGQSARLEPGDVDGHPWDVVVVCGNLERVDPGGVERLFSFDPESAGVRAAGAPALVLVTDDIEPYRSLFDLPPAGIAILPSDADRGEIVSAIRASAEGLLVGTTELIRKMYFGSRRTAGGRREDLTQREPEVLRLLSLGLSNKAIAADLDISEHTVKFHISSIYSKLDASNRVEAIRNGIRSGLLNL